MAKNLRANSIKAAHYHAGMTAWERSKVQEDFINDKVPVITATIAFGMGIDKPDVRLVAHIDILKSIEGYYQETGPPGAMGCRVNVYIFFARGCL